VPQKIDLQNTDTLSDSASLFRSHRWAKVLTSSYGLKIDHFNYSGYQIPYASVDNVLGKKISLLPFSDYIELDNTEQNLWPELISELQLKFDDRSIVVKHLGNETSITKNQKVIRNACRHVIPLNDKLKLSGSFKHQVNQARKADIHFRQNTDLSALDTFYDLYRLLRFNKFKSIPQPKIFFANVCREFIDKGQGFFAEIVHQEKVIASAMILKCELGWNYKFGTSDVDYLHLRPNNLLFSELIEQGRAQKIDRIDLGLSGMSDSYAGLRKFKASMGGVQEPVTYIDYNPQKTDPNMDRINKELIQPLTQVIVANQMDVKTTSALSEQLYPLFA